MRLTSIFSVSSTSVSPQSESRRSSIALSARVEAIQDVQRREVNLEQKSFPLMEFKDAEMETAFCRYYYGSRMYVNSYALIISIRLKVGYMIGALVWLATLPFDLLTARTTYDYVRSSLLDIGPFLFSVAIYPFFFFKWVQKRPRVYETVVFLSMCVFTSLIGFLWGSYVDYIAFFPYPTPDTAFITLMTCYSLTMLRSRISFAIGSISTFFMLISGLIYCLLMILQPYTQDLDDVYVKWRPARLYICYVAGFILITMMGTMESFLIERYFRQSFIAKKTLEIEQDVLDKELERSKQILCNILPSIFVEELSETSDTGALLLSRRPLKLFKDVTILISDIVNFTTWSSTKTSEYVVHMLNTQFSALDQLASDMGLEKVKTVGDSWICCGNLTSNDNDAGLKMVELGMSMLEEINRLNRERGWFIQLRIGIAKGDIYSGVIGVSKQSFDCYGPAVEIAHLMESNSQPDTVQVNDTLLPDIEEHYTYKPHTFNSDTGWITGYFITGEKDDMIEQTIEEIEAELRAETPSLSPRSDQELIEKESIKHVPVYKQTQVLYKLNKWIMMFPTVKQNIEVFRYTFPGLLNVYKAVVVVQTGTFMYLVGVDIMNYETSIDSGNMIVEYVTMVTYTFVLILYCTPLSSRFPLFTVVVIVLTVVANFIIGISTTINSALEPSILGKVSLAIIMYV